MVVSSLVRRGVELASEHLQKHPKQPSKQPPEIQLSGWLAALFFATLIAFVLISWSIEYTYGMVVTTLAAVEDSNPDIYVRIDGDMDPIKPGDDVEPNLAAVPPKPITSKLRTAIKHLRARAGPWSRFRGMSMFLTYLFARGFLLSMMPFELDQFVFQFIFQMVVGVLLAKLQLAWVHIVISEPSPKRFYQRIPGYQAWLKIAPVVAFEHAVAGLAFYVPLIVMNAYGLLEKLASAPDDGVPPAETVRQALTVVALPSLLSLIASIPARVVFIRVAASMLPEEDESIVPFDRSFGGKVAPAILGGSGKLSITDAWKTFDRAARIRFLKVVGKVMALEFGVFVFFSLALAGEIYMGAEALMKIIADMIARSGGSA
ncbi:hypothetical protein KXX16_008494 [Aspergillus fumigatus]|nr:hypothetical protein KXX31_008420 [Aspergillus fumigatus]KAH1648773.1 hypothetical protein KXX16_008494 [Aspergillus fumigatus]KAH1669507.1 hypothetical protein KXX65_008234 [Aspergillus fumigatus]KAH1808713.1 hypothetical protein KXX19_009268 [Aspergillus fumigatus]KAH2392104.1 hypothetical protein KXW92_008936 [Aspergillus fumigatus]